MSIFRDFWDVFVLVLLGESKEVDLLLVFTRSRSLKAVLRLSHDHTVPIKVKCCDAGGDHWTRTGL